MGFFNFEKWNWEHLNISYNECADVEGDDGWFQWWIALILSLTFLFFMIILRIRLDREQDQDIFFIKFYEDRKHDGISEEYVPFFIRDWWKVCKTLARKSKTMMGVIACYTLFILFLTLAVLQKSPWEYSSLFVIFPLTSLVFIQNYCMTSFISAEDINTVEARDKIIEYTPKTIYQDLSAPWLHVIFVFLQQIFLTLIYIFSVFESNFPPCLKLPLPQLLFVLAAILKALYHSIVYTYNYSSGLSDRSHWVGAYVKAKSNEDLSWNNDVGGDTWHEDRGEYWHVTWAHPHRRNKLLTKRLVTVHHFLDMFINHWVDFIIGAFMVIQAANGDFSDFVLNFVAAQFIMQLDDYNNYGDYTTSFKIELVREQDDINSHPSLDERNYYTQPSQEDAAKANHLRDLFDQVNKERSELEWKIKILEAIKQQNGVNNEIKDDERSECDELKELKDNFDWLEGVMEKMEQKFSIDKGPNENKLSKLAKEVNAMMTEERDELEGKIAGCNFVIKNNNIESPKAIEALVEFQTEKKEWNTLIQEVNDKIYIKKPLVTKRNIQEVNDKIYIKKPSVTKRNSTIMSDMTPNSTV